MTDKPATTYITAFSRTRNRAVFEGQAKVFDTTK